MSYLKDFFYRNRKLCAKKKKPNTKKNFFQNYANHLDMFVLNFAQKAEKQLGIEPEFSDLALFGFDYLIDLKFLLMLEPLRDGHDYFDEILGTTVVPLLSTVAGIGCLGLAIYEAALKFATATGLKKNGNEDHGSNAITYFAAFGAALAVSALSAIKSVFSLVSRPIATMIEGWKPQDEDRFYREGAFSI